MLDESARGVYVISVTPFDDRGALDLDGTDRLIDYYAGTGVDGITILGVMGEAPKLAHEEAIAFARRVITRADRLPVVVGVSSPGLASLAALTKGGLNTVTRSLAIEFADRGVRVNAVAPGVVATPMHPAETHEFLAGLQPMGRIGEIQNVVDAVLYLEAASFVTGEILHVDGGAHAGCW